MNEQKLISAISTLNPWWKGLPVPVKIKKSENKRKVFYEVAEKCIEDEKIISLSGPRQVGKTTLMGQLIEYQIQTRNIDPKRVIYLPIDNELLLLNSDNVLHDCMKVYVDFFLRESPDNLKNKIYIFLDEVQSLDNWAKLIKTYHDSYDKMKFIVSGSSQTKLYTDASESLVGRITFRTLLPFKFKEYVEYYMPVRSKNLDFSTWRLREALKKSIETKNPTPLYEATTFLSIQLAGELPEIKKLIDSYLIKGGYPGLLEYGENYDKALERLKTDLELTVYKDIHKTFNTRNSEDIMNLLTLLASSSGQKVNHLNLSQTLGTDRRTVASYIQYLKLLFMVVESPFCQINVHEKVSKMSKIYLADTGHRNALLGKMNSELLGEAEAGLVIQTAVFNHACRLKYYLSKYTDFEICYWEDRDSEVDIVFDLPIVTLPVEVKSKSGTQGLKAVHKFVEQHAKSHWGVIVSKDDLAIDKNILFIPLWAFLLMC
jgi:predicted AAA+ superfamily ATPase